MSKVALLMGDKFLTPTARTHESLSKEVAKIIAELRPFVQGDGGDIELVNVGDDGVMSVRLLGACIGCPSSGMTLKMGVEQSLKDRLPEIKEVVCV